MKLGDFTELAKNYKHRPGYSEMLLKYIASYIGAYREDFRVADVGAGTGKLTENLTQIGLKGIAVEPNNAMRNEGIKSFNSIDSFNWISGSAECTNIETESVDWVLMGSSFHWTDNEKALKEFNRILKPHGFFTVIYNPRDIEKNKLHIDIEENIKKMVPHLKRHSSGHKNNVSDLETTLCGSNDFHNYIFMEAPHIETMTKERYIGAWRSVNDIQVQAGDKLFEEIINMISHKIEHLNTIKVPYKTRAWTIQKKG